MFKRLILSSLLVTLIGIIFFSFLFAIYFGYKFYKSIFRLSPSQISDSIKNEKSRCQRIQDCSLAPGDILVRRYITPTTWSFNEFAHPYFTHSAFYLGDNQLVEAVGTEKNHQNEIQIVALPASDWLNSGIQSFVVIRPKNIAQKFSAIKVNLENISNDPDYEFGLPEPGYKRTTCADLIFQQLITEHVVAVSYVPKIITPDYLFWLAVHDPNDFYIVGYNIDLQTN